MHQHFSERFSLLHRSFDGHLPLNDLCTCIVYIFFLFSILFYCVPNVNINLPMDYRWKLPYGYIWHIYL